MLQPDGSNELRVLLIEDSREDAELLIAALRRYAFGPLAERVWTEDQTRAALAEGQWEAIIADYHVPGFGAAEALAIAKAEDFDGPFIVVSSLVGEESAVALMRAGAHDFIMKDNLARLGPALGRELSDAAIRREKRAAQSELELRERQLRELTQFLRTIREEEQTRIGRELHDELGQTLTSLKLDLSWLKTRVLPEQTAIRGKIESMYWVIDAAVDAVHRIAADLRPAMLDDLGLAAAVQWQLKQFRESTGAETALRLSHEEFDVSHQVATTAYRVVQESLTNAARHAHATRIAVSVQQSPSSLSVEIEDDGCGFIADNGGDGQTVRKTVGEHSSAGHRRVTFGLLGLRERVHGLRGEFHIESEVGRGTTVRARIPLVSVEGNSA